jgi:hypothetical protein
MTPGMIQDVHYRAVMAVDTEVMKVILQDPPADGTTRITTAAVCMEEETGWIWIVMMTSTGIQKIGEAAETGQTITARQDKIAGITAMTTTTAV